MRQGRCWYCEIRWTWDRNLQPDNATCPECGRLLKKTTHLCEDETRTATVVSIARVEYLKAIDTAKAGA